MPDRPEMLKLDTPVGPARAYVSDAVNPVATLVLGHGAGGGSEAADLVALVALTRHGIRVIRVDQPWRVAGRRVAAPPATLDKAWLAIVPQLPLAGAVVLGGRSAGARVACRTAATLDAAGVLALAFPLHPPGRPERSRADELATVSVPVLVVQGERDAFGSPDDVRAAVGDVRVLAVPHADHGMKVPARTSPTRAEALRSVAESVVEFVLSVR